MRVFIPISRVGLRSLVESGGIGPPPIVGFAVTGALREWYADGDEEELEYVAMTLAAQASLELQTPEDEPQPRRMVLAVDTDNAVPGPVDFRAAVTVDSAIAGRQVDALLMDTDDAAADVAAAVGVLRDGGPGNDDEQFVVDNCEGHELAWFAAQEITDLL